MRQKGLTQVVVALVCAFATCIPCKTVLANEQVGAGAIDVSVTQIVSKDEPAKDEPTNGEPAKEDPENSDNPGSNSESENNGSNKSQADPSEESSSKDKKNTTTPEALNDARRVASENAWAVAPVSDNNKTNDNTGDNSSTQASGLSLAQTGDDGLAGTASVIGCIGVGMGAIALIMRARDNRNESNGTREVGDEQS